ncbi:MAG: DUF2851 family protein [Bacteroidales bacterium]|nr:DUF2851 family protein [Bacteroidales bacterium]
MEERILYFIWKYKLYNQNKLQTSQGSRLEIISPGVQNFDSGPDFTNAKIKIGSTTWAGNVEIHIKASDWYAHKHQNDKAYNNVILHVVYDNNQEIFNQKNEKIPTLELKPDEILLDKYKVLIDNKQVLSCSDDLHFLENFKLKLWLNNVLFERLNEKTNFIKEKLTRNKNNWEESFYQIIARNFGFKLNAEPFERLAASLPLKYLAKHHDNLLQIEALLFGQAGFLADEFDNEYYHRLKKEYKHLANKFGLKPIEKYNWKFLRTRPGNFPTIRIAQFARLIYQSVSLFSKIIDADSISDVKTLFQVKASEFWKNHYTFAKKSTEKEKVLGESSLNNILINTLIPFLFLYGEAKDNQELKDKAVNWLEEIKAENNKITRMWEDAGVKIHNAFFSQAVIQQTNNYCKQGKCLDCGIGAEILKHVYSSTDS